MKLNGTLKSLICEIASIDNVQSAVNNRNVAIINYDGDEPGGKGIREVHCTVFEGNFSGFQQAGGCK